MAHLIHYIGRSEESEQSQTSRPTSPTIPNAPSVFGVYTNQPPTIASVIETQRRYVGMNNGQLLEHGTYSDMIIKCGPISYKAHRAIVLPNSTILTSMVEKSDKGKNVGTIDLTNTITYPNTIPWLLNFLYRSGYSTTWLPTIATLPTHQSPSQPSLPKPGKITNPLSLSNNARMHIIAHSLSIKNLQTLSLLKYHKALQDGYLDDIMDDFVESVRILYEGLEEREGEMKLVAAGWAAKNLRVLAGEEKFMELVGERKGFLESVFRST